MKRALIVLLLAVSGCGGKSPPSMSVDATLQREQNAGRSALSLEHPAQAVANYKAALVRAEIRDDPDAIADIGFNLAVAQLRAGTASDALATTRAVRTELARRGIAAVPAHDLAEATALYRTGDIHAAARLADGVRGSSDTAAAARAAFLRGLIADGASDLAGLSATRASLSATGSGEVVTDTAELDARIAFGRAAICSIIEDRRGPWRWRRRRTRMAIGARRRICIYAPGAAPPRRTIR